MSYDLVLVGSSFASSFFLAEYLRHAPADARVLVLERGPRIPHAERRGRLPSDDFVNLTPAKPWTAHHLFGGCSNCWWGQTPRMLPEDFELASRYGVGVDWPVSYDELEPFYCDAEELLGVAGPSERTPFRRSRPYPQPAHRLSSVDRALASLWPDSFFAVPCARPTRRTADGRPPCCGSAVCEHCPIDSKFTVENGMRSVFEDRRVTLELEALAVRLEVYGDSARSLVYTRGAEERSVEAELFALGAGGLGNPALLLRSGFDHPELGRGLCEQIGVYFWVHTDGIDNFDGSTSVTGHGYMLYGGERRRERASALVETFNFGQIRLERGKWRRVLFGKLVYEDLRQPGNRLEVLADDPLRPRLSWHGPSAWTQRSLDRAREDLEAAFGRFPHEDMGLGAQASTENHVIGTVPMGSDPQSSVVDRHLLHHRVRNLAVLGSAVYPTAAPANPTLTLCALSLFSARHLYG